MGGTDIRGARIREMTVVLEVARGSQPTEGARSTSVELARTASLCPHCKSLLPAQVVERSGAVYIRRTCEVHGDFETLLSSDATYYRKALRYNKAGTKPLEFTTQVERGCPFDCGLCPDHQQHTCLGILEITQKCNLTCPVCFADSSPQRTHFLTLAECEAAIDNFVRCEGSPEVLMLSGGEPTIHPEIVDIVAMAQRKGIPYVTINTNGLRLQDDAFVRELAPYRPYIYLQFDGFSRPTHEALRGVDLRAAKARAIENCRRAGLDVILVPTVYRGVNGREVGSIVRYAMGHPAIRGVLFQPTTFVGRCLPPQPEERITVADVLRLVEEGTDGLFRMDDFFPVPCPWPPSSAVTYVWVRDNGQLIPIPRLVNIDEYLDYIENRVLPNPTQAAIQSALEKVYSSSAVPGSDAIARNLCVACNIPLDLDAIKERVKLIGVFAFCDEWNFDLRCAKKCCIHEIFPDGRIIPFCNYNILYRPNGGRAP